MICTLYNAVQYTLVTLSEVRHLNKVWDNVAHDHEWPDQNGAKQTRAYYQQMLALVCALALKTLEI